MITQEDKERMLNAVPVTKANNPPQHKSAFTKTAVPHFPKPTVLQPSVAQKVTTSKPIGGHSGIGKSPKRAPSGRKRGY